MITLFLSACCIVLLVLLTFYQTRNEYEYKTWLAYLRVALFTASLFALLLSVNQGMVVLVFSIVVSIVVSFVSAGMSDDWANGVFASIMLAPFALGVFWLAASLIGWESVAGFFDAHREVVGNIVQGYCGTLLIFLPACYKIREELEKY